jgi:hypothetical protein
MPRNAPAQVQYEYIRKIAFEWMHYPSPGHGVILQDIVEPDEFIVPQSFRGNHRLASR